MISKKYRLRDGKYKLIYWISQTLSKHKENGYIINVKSKELAIKWRDIKHCQLCGIELDFTYGKEKAQHNSPSIDRTNNEKIMNIDNIQLLCLQCNSMKRNFNLNDLKNRCMRIINNINNIKCNSIDEHITKIIDKQIRFG